MKSHTINMIVIEGPDGVGKDSIASGILKHFNYTMPVHVRSEMSDIIYARKFGRVPSCALRGFPILFVYLTATKEAIKERMIKRLSPNCSEEQIEEELSTLDDVDKFEELYKDFVKDYHCIRIDNSDLTAEETEKKAEQEIEKYISSLEEDDPSTYTMWNKVYAEQCDKVGKTFSVRKNQPYIDGVPVMVEANLQNGVYETFSDKRMPDNLIYSLQYDRNISLPDVYSRKYDFAYVVFSKICSRPELYEYFDEMIKAGKTCVVGGSQYVFDDPNLIKTDVKKSGNDYIRLIAQARATVYTQRRLAYLRLQTARLYESIIAGQVVFVDAQSDPDNEILSQIYDRHDLVYLNGEKVDLVDFLRIDSPKDLPKKYDELFKNEDVVRYIVGRQKKWYNRLIEDTFGKDKEL